MEPKKEADGDIEMKFDESPPSPRHGDISPINGSISNLADDGKASTSKPPRKTEPSFEVLPNLSRVTPAQLAYITFPDEGRYQPVRAVSPAGATASKSPSSSTLGLASGKYAGGGGILILADLQPDEEAEFIEFNPVILLPPQDEAAPTHLGNGHAVHAPPPSGPHIAMDDSMPDIDPPEAFEVCRYLIFKYDVSADQRSLPLAVSVQ